ncbi:MAG: 4Fe-4S dicluster domain-containing protein, partial [Deltaproteobacteria bacterium]|nr:4Fe-4S dicluster domain-containing protein [Deltaproteobacteria bacterium]
MENVEKQVREHVKKLLADGTVDIVVGYEKGTLPFQTAPCFITAPDDAERLVWNRFCSVNLAKYVHDIIFGHKESQKRAKPEETRSLIIHLQEKQYDRDQVVIIGVPCTGFVANKKLSAAVSGKEVIACSAAGESLSLQTKDGEKAVSLKEVLADNCLTCRFNNPIISDVMIGEAAPPMPDVEKEYEEVEAFEALSVDERWAYFTKEMGKCIRCYACRNTCPSCYCKVCFVEQNQPKWVGVGIDETDTQVFQFMRMFHMVGRCVDCGSCLEVCPMGVDLRKFLKKLDKDDFQLFDHRAGESMESAPTLSV